MSVKERAMLVNLSTSHWTAKKFDAKVTKEIDETHGSENSGRFNKTLIISDLLSDISSCIGKARTYHYKVTMAWDDAGPRLLPVTNYFDYTKKMEEFQVEHKELVRKFLKEYPELKERAKQRLNTLFNEVDYPDEQSLANKFNLSYKITLIADEDDLRISLSEDEIKEIKKNIQSSLSDRINNAKNSIVERAETVINALHEKLQDNTATFRDSLIGNVVSLAELMPSMNFDNDEQFDWLEKKLMKFNLDPSKLRKNMELRQKTAKKAKKLLKKIKTIHYGEIDTAPYVEVKEKKKEKKKDKKKTKRIRRK